MHNFLNFRHLGSYSNRQTPTYCNAKNGEKTCGNINTLITSVSDGAEIHVVTGGYAVELSNVAYNNQKSLASGTHLWHVSQKSVGNRNEFQKNVYWWFTIWSTDAFFDMSRWSVGTHTSRRHNNNKLAINWCVDPCWSLAYEHDENGKVIKGSLTSLRSAVHTGKRVRIVIGNYAIEADTLDIRGDHITAQVLGHVSKAGLKSFQSNAYWYWQNYATSGTVYTIRYNVGANVNRGNTVSRRRIKWFIDTRPWSHVLSHSTSGKVNHWSKSALVNEIRKGKMVRFVVKYKRTASSTFSVYNADNTQIDGSEVAAQHIRTISVQDDGAGSVKFQSNPYWNFIIATTTGKVSQSRWTVGEHANRGNPSTTADIKWFTS